MASDGPDVDVADRDELATAIGLYPLGEISPGKAAERAGITRWEFIDHLLKAGVHTPLGPLTEEDAHLAIETALDVE